jgi:hypothetical protein
MNRNPSSGSHPRRWPRWASITAALSAGGATLLIWFEEVVAFAVEFIGVIFLPILAGIIYLFNHLIFKSAIPRREDMENTTNIQVTK